MLTNQNLCDIMGTTKQERSADMLYMNVKQIAEKAGVTRKRVYYIKDKLGHLPSVEEVKNYKPVRKRGRPTKYSL